MRSYSVQPTMFVNRFSQAQAPVAMPDKKLVEQLHKLLDLIPSDDHAFMIDHVVADLLRVHVRPDGMFEPELLTQGGQGGQESE